MQKSPKDERGQFDLDDDGQALYGIWLVPGEDLADDAFLRGPAKINTL